MDVDTILVGIRLASHGHNLDSGSQCPKCNHDHEFTIDLRVLLDSIQSPNYDTCVRHGDLEFYFRPMTYQDLNANNQLQFEQQKKIQSIQESTLPDDEKIKQLNQILTHITELTVDALKHSISSISTPQALVTETSYIQEFLNNIDRKIFNLIRDHIIKLRADSEIKPLDLTCTECAHKYQQVVNMDQTSFFEAAS
jgi:bacterioferritin-associated ferredoxin